MALGGWEGLKGLRECERGYVGVNLSYGCLQKHPTPTQHTTPNTQNPTPTQLPSNSRLSPWCWWWVTTGDTPTATAHSSADLIKGIENKWGNTKLVLPTAAMISMVYRRNAVAARLIIRSALTCLKGRPHVDAPRVQTVVTKRESFWCQVALSNQWQLVLEHFLLISNLKIQIWNTEISSFLRSRRPSMAGRPFVEQPLQFL